MKGGNCMVYETVVTKNLKKRMIVRDPDDAYKLVKQFAKSRQEQLIVITLDTCKYVIGVHVIHIGTVNKTFASTKDIFYKAIMDNACFIIVCHNHPGGDYLEPSENDLKTADKLYKAGAIMDIRVKDQLIISEYGYTSMKPSVEEILKGEIKLE
jgi:DNA repair protein RadC